MIRPLSDIVFIRRAEQEGVIGSIIIPDQAQKKATRGEIVAAGPGLLKNGKRRPMGVSVGDIVHFNAWIGEEREVNGEKLVAMHEDEIEAVETA